MNAISKALVAASLVSTALVSTVHAEEPPEQGPVVVAAWQLEDLKSVVQRLLTAVRTATLSNNNAEVIPRQKDRDGFVQDMDSIRRVANGRGGFDQWIDDVRRQTPLPNDSRKYYLRDFQVIGFGPSEEVAAEDMRKECKSVEALMKDALETSYGGVICGTGAQTLALNSGKTFASASRAIIVVRVPKAMTVETRTGDWITSGNLEAGVRNYRAWQEACKSWLFEQFNVHGEKLVGASCGPLDSITSSNYQSQGRVFLRK